MSGEQVRRFALAALRAALLAAAAVSLAGCAAGAASRQGSPEDKTAKLQQLPADIMKAGDEAARRGELDRAASLYMQAIELEPSAELWYRLGYIYARLDKKSLAVQAYAAALSLDDQHAGAHEELGLLLLEAKRREQARTQLARAAELDPKRWRAHNALGVLADARGDYPSAIAHYEAALAVNPNSPMLLNNLGYSHYLAGDFARAAEYYGKSLAIDPAYRPAMANVALLHARRRDYEKALEIMLKLGDRPRAYNDIGYVALRNGDFDIAEPLLNEAVRLSPTYYRKAHENLQRLHNERDQRMAREQRPPATGQFIATAPAQAPQTPTAVSAPIALQAGASPAAATAPEGPPAAGSGAATPATAASPSQAALAPAAPDPDAAGTSAPPEYRRVRIEAADLRLARDPNAPVVGSLHAGAHVKVLRVEADWTLVSYGEEGGDEPVTVGWVRSQDLTAARRRPAG